MPSSEIQWPAFLPREEPQGTAAVGLTDWKNVHIVIRYLSGAEAGRKEVFSPRRILIGRDQDCDLCFDRRKDLEVSGRHAEITPTDSGEFEIVDLNSTNGLWVNGSEVQRCKLRSGDEIELGPGGPRLRFLVRRRWLQFLKERLLRSNKGEPSRG